MIYGSVCSGIEAATVAWHPLGWKAAWLSEIEKYPSSVLAHHYPAVPNLGDMRQIARLILIGQVDAPDVLVGGTPCQAFSIAGLREGLDDARGQLTLSYVRLFDAIDYVRGRSGREAAICVWENVPGVLSDKTNAFGCLLAGLAGEDVELKPAGKKWTNAGCVFGPKRTVAWRVLDAQYLGVAQRRRRVFVIASARKGFNPAEVLFEFDGVRRDTAPSREARQDVAGTLASRTEGDGFPGTDEACSGYLQPVASTGDVSHCLNAGGMGRQDFETETLITQAAREPLPFDTTQITSATNRCRPEHGDPCHPLAAGAHPPAIAFDSRQDPVSSEHVFGALGSSSPQAQAVAMTFDWQAGAGGNDTSFRGKSRAYITDPPDRTRALTACRTLALMTPEMAVRRLTPIECERLQGFPDSHTFVPGWNGWRAMDASETPESCRAAGLEVRQTKKGKWRVKDVDGPRYKALGNSMAVPCMRWLGQRIDAAVHAISQ